MPAVTIRKISVKTHQALKKRAKKNGNSTEAEIRLILDEAAKPQALKRASKPDDEQSSKPEVGLGTLLQELGRKYGPLPEITRDKSPSQPAIFG